MLPIQKPHRPNLLFVTCDQLRFDALGCYGNPVCRTPVIDRLAAKGTRFDRMYVCSPACAPSRASIATGRFPSAHGVITNGCILRDDELTFMETLRRSGYWTIGTGKMHFRPQWKHKPDELARVIADSQGEGALNPQPTPDELPFYGFEATSMAEDHNGGPYGDYLRDHGLDPWADPHSFSFPQSAAQTSAFPAELHKTTWIADRTIQHLNERPTDQPFCCWMSFVNPHHPFTPPAPYDRMYDPADMPLPSRTEEEIAGWPESYLAKSQATEGSHEAVGLSDFADAEWQRIKAHYYGMITHIDENLGRVIEWLEQSGQRENTVIIFTSDHGEMLGDHGLLFKGTLYPEIIRVPFIVSGPDPVQDVVRGDFAQLCDVMPTLLAFAGLPAEPAVQGRDLFATTPVVAADEVFVEVPNGSRCLHDREWHFVWHGRGKRGELYHLIDDPGCFHNLWDSPVHESVKRDCLERVLARMVQPEPKFAPHTIS